MSNATLLAWLRLLALDGELARAEPKTLRYKILHTAAGPQRAPADNLPNLAVGDRDSQRLDPPQHPAAGPLSSTKPSPRPRKSSTGAAEPPATRPASRATAIPAPWSENRR